MRIIGILTNSGVSRHWSAATPNGVTCVDLCRKHGMSEGAFCNWKAKFAGMTVLEAKRLKTLEDRNVVTCPFFWGHS